MAVPEQGTPPPTWPCPSGGGSNDPPPAVPAAAPPRVHPLSRRLAKPAEIALYLLAGSGLLLFGMIGVPWPLARWALLIHIAVAVIAVPAVVVPFWVAHRGILARRRRPFHRWTGRIIEGVLAATLAGGVWLFLIGANGTTGGAIAHWAHLVLSLPLIALVTIHAWRYSAVRLLARTAAVAALLTGMTSAAHAANPTPNPAAPGHAVHSDSIILAGGGQLLYTANFDGGSVSKIDRTTGRRLAEGVLGGDIRTVAVAPDAGLVAATDYTGGALYLLRADDLSTVRRVALDGRPYGVVYDGRNRLFWVTATEGGRLYGIGMDGTVRVDMPVIETPRGLALMPDGRLLVTHAMVGKVSIYETAQVPPRRRKVITLRATQHNADQTVSQGLPRGLDVIAVSPDGKQAWLPHMLWNFDHPFQFQSTVFPAVSVLSLAPGHEHEVPSRRKQLFKQIDILEDGKRTRIVSNPQDAAFSDDGTKVYVTMAGSEDLVVFDLARAAPIDSHSRRARSSPGAKAVQIRRLPGDNPRGLVVDGTDIYVQNAMGLDLSRLTTGGDGPFARVRAVKDRFASLVADDPLPPALRRGERLFYLGNTDATPDTPMAGDNWMSCGSCHVDGFNFTNRYLFRDTPVDKFHSTFTGHGSIEHLVAGDFVGDYLRMIRNTQGGMGADTRFPTPNIDPDHPPAKVRAMMKDLHAFVTSPGNLPLLATWLRGEDGGARIDPAQLQNSAACGTCHSRIFKQWSNSLHRLMGQSNPYYMVMEDMAAESEGEPFRAWCMGCHAPQATLTGATRTEGPSHLFETGGASLKQALDDGTEPAREGTGCVFCHRISKLETAGVTAGANASFTVDLDDRKTYLFEQSSNEILRWLGDRQIRALPETHAESYSRPFYSDSRLCASCHEEFAPGTGAYIIKTYSEWAQSSFNAPGDPAHNRTCMDCHMHGDPDRIGKPVPGIATDGGPVQPDMVSHQFTGGNYHLVGLRDPELRAKSIALLRSAARLDARIDSPADGSDRLVVRVRNVGAGHKLPAGVSSFRQMWLMVTATDSSGRVVLRSGQPAPDGTLPEDTRIFHKVLGDKDGNPVGVEFWRFAKMLKDTRIPTDGYRDEPFALPADTAWPVKVDVRLMFRTYPQWITDMVRKRYPEMPPPHPVEMSRLEVTLERP